MLIRFAIRHAHCHDRPLGFGCAANTKTLREDQRARALADNHPSFGALSIHPSSKVPSTLTYVLPRPFYKVRTQILPEV